MQYWLMKSEPDVWSIDQQKKAGTKGAPWDGVRNYQAAKNLKNMRKGDQCFFYHSNIGKEIVGIVEVVREHYIDKTDKSGKFVAVTVKFLKKLDKPVSLENIKNEQDKFDLAASFQKTIEDILYKKTKIAFNEFEKLNNLKEKIFVVAGGVAANKNIRIMLINLCKEKNYKSIFPTIDLCGDNAAMIAMVGLEKFKLKEFSNLDHPAKPRWPLDEKAAFLKGAGVQL